MHMLSFPPLIVSCSIRQSLWCAYHTDRLHLLICISSGNIARGVEIHCVWKEFVPSSSHAASHSTQDECVVHLLDCIVYTVHCTIHSIAYVVHYYQLRIKMVSLHSGLELFNSSFTCVWNTAVAITRNAWREIPFCVRLSLCWRDWPIGRYIKVVYLGLNFS